MHLSAGRPPAAFALRVCVAALIAAAALPSVASAGTVFLLDGRGWGHGVGLSQWGAEGYARHGYAYPRILAHYYPHTALTKVQPRPVRVLLVRGKTSVRVGSTAPFLLVDERGSKVHLRSGSVVVGGRFLRSHPHLKQPLRFEPGAQPLQVDRLPYRGDVVIKRRSDGLMAVNVLPLDRYLRGVVPWEAPTGWHVATYEAQAVAARSYTLATLHPGQDFDLYPDQRSQMYGGIRAERPETNLAIGATAGQVLTYGGHIITAYYFSSSGGRTSAIQDAWPGMAPEPYLVSVSDPYDYISPHHVWPTRVLTAAGVGSVLGVTGVRDARVMLNSSERAESVRVLGANGWRSFPAAVVIDKFHLGSNDFDLSALTLDAATGPTSFGSRFHVTGWVRGLGKARLQELTSSGWQTVAHVRSAPSGRFALALHATRSIELRLAYDGVAGDVVPFTVQPRVLLRAEGTSLRVSVAPRLPLQVERLTNAQWRPVARANGRFDRTLRPGSYRVSVGGDGGFAATVSAPVGLHG
jgi:stage II sporulation protein D